MVRELHVCPQEESEYVLTKMITLSSIPVSVPKKTKYERELIQFHGH